MGLSVPGVSDGGRRRIASPANVRAGQFAATSLLPRVARRIGRALSRTHRALRGAHRRGVLLAHRVLVRRLRVLLAALFHGAGLGIAGLQRRLVIGVGPGLGICSRRAGHLRRIGLRLSCGGWRLRLNTHGERTDDRCVHRFAHRKLHERLPLNGKETPLTCRRRAVQCPPIGVTDATAMPKSFPLSLQGVGESSPTNSPETPEIFSVPRGANSTSPSLPCGANGVAKPVPRALQDGDQRSKPRARRRSDEWHRASASHPRFSLDLTQYAGSSRR